ncbi:hypothetical protein [Photobacterium sp.]|uniref:hypothetical protein n=1 Tax=Photobacterium sp. TaxID=660 RepID=UPI00299F4158|nr:hypothetical protein [Photobacterium sp.]MDX1303636.1 hypothetical protein [Photobacterium sp.]
MNTEKWYHKKSFVVLIIFIVGPFALPLVWMSPNITLKWKIVVTIGLTVLTYFTYQSYLEVKSMADDYMQLLQ